MRLQICTIAGQLRLVPGLLKAEVSFGGFRDLLQNISDTPLRRNDPLISIAFVLAELHYHWTTPLRPHPHTRTPPTIMKRGSNSLILGLLLLAGMAVAGISGRLGPRTDHTCPPSQFLPSPDALPWRPVDLTDQWWDWALSQQAEGHPLNDITGDLCGVNQRGDTWFLGGSFNTSDLVPGCTRNDGQLDCILTRTCQIPKNRNILVPILNGECSEAEGNGDTKDALCDCATGLAVGVTTEDAWLDTTKLEKTQVQSRKAFKVRLPTVDNVLGRPNPQPNPTWVWAYGWWTYIAKEDLSAGEHDLKFAGAVPPYFSLRVTYHLVVAG